MAVFAVSILVGGAGAQVTGVEFAVPPPATPPSEVAPGSSEALTVVPSAPDAADAGAKLYMLKCMGCHTIGGGQLSGPDLKPMSGWPRENLEAGVRRMEKSVGPLSSEAVTELTDLLLSTDAAERIKTVQQAMALQQAATLEPPSAEKGEALFLGRTSFAGGGISCAACHQAGGKGGSMASSLEDAYTRLGEVPLLATCEAPGYPVMRAIYAPHPVTKQEAIHIVSYLQSVSEEAAPPLNPPMSIVGLIGGIGLTLAMGMRSGHKSIAGTRARMVAQAHQRRDMGRGRTS